ncbi:MAG TPA: glycine hydroxymethyltransferase, partial [Myxococcota bacterium]|nr:glycine hydroxymethyltransferase [Myxococcota bacterium]
MNQSLLDTYLTQTSPSARSSAVTAYIAVLDHLKREAPEIAAAIIKELHDQRSHLKLIASENYCSLTVQLAMGNLLTDKYAEGYPYHRFYAGCENVDTVESKCENLAKDLFKAEHAYVQPHSGSDANLVAFWAILTQKIQFSSYAALGKKISDELSNGEFEKVRQQLCNQALLGLSLHSGGHLTHGFKHNVSGKMFRSVSYDIDPKTGLLNYDQMVEVGRREKPLILLGGYSAYPRKTNFAKMREIADDIGAILMVDMAHFAGLVAGGALSGEENPVPYAHILTSTTHKTLRGPR